MLLHASKGCFPWLPRSLSGMWCIDCLRRNHRVLHAVNIPGIQASLEVDAVVAIRVKNAVL